ncbi:hypothetical protein [Nocardioides gilvus]|uniref:hypothetical protein n=1 Tax=Nocardioides gilvus TaxID=1735589 RepID=UPI0019514DB5|nr:hypothetical protein [Nocardioides gilvus]
MPLTAPDTLRVLAAVTLVPAVVNHGVIGLALILLVLGGCMVPRALGTTAWLDAAFCSAALFAAWAALLDWYVSVEWLDLAVHTVFTALLGLLAWQLLLRSGVLAEPTTLLAARLGAVVFTTTMATTLAALWEIGEWLGHNHLDSSIQVGYQDTLSDLAAGVLGALAAGMLAAAVAAGSPQPVTATVEDEYAR